VMGLDAGYLAGEATKVLQALQAHPNAQPGVLGDELAATDEDLIFPAWLMKNRRMDAAIAGDLNREIRALKAGVAAAAPEVQEILRVLMSDAISRKVRMRFLGTGVGRFALSFGSTSMVRHFSTSLSRYVKV